MEQTPIKIEFAVFNRKIRYMMTTILLTFLRNYWRISRRWHRLFRKYL